MSIILDHIAKSPGLMFVHQFLLQWLDKSSGAIVIAVSNPTFESKAPLTMFARLHILAHTACRNSASSTGAKSQKAVFPLIPPKRASRGMYVSLALVMRAGVDGRGGGSWR